jgi:hypothetical protein
MTTGLIRPMSSGGFEKGYHDNDYLAVSFINNFKTHPTCAIVFLWKILMEEN